MRDLDQENGLPQEDEGDEGGDKEKGKVEKQSKLGKLRQQFGKGGNEADRDRDNAVKLADKKSETNITSDPGDLTETKETEIPKEKELITESGEIEHDSFSSNEPITNDKTEPAYEDISINDEHNDCSNLTDYLENAILESANSTIDRTTVKPMQENPNEKVQSDVIENIEQTNQAEGADCEEVVEVVAEPESLRVPSQGLFAEYVNFDFLNADTGSNGSSEYYSSDDESRENRNLNNNSNIDVQSLQSNHEQSNDSSSVLRPKDLKINQLSDEKTDDKSSAKPGESSPRASIENLERNNVENRSKNEQRCCESVKGDDGDKVLTSEEKTTDAFARIGDGNTGNEKNSSVVYGYSIDLSASRVREHAESTVEGITRESAGFSTERKYIESLFVTQHQEICPFYDVTIEDLSFSWNNADMDRAKNLFSMCLCHNGEKVDNVTDLDFRNCNLKQVPNEIFQYAETLTSLQLDSNTLSDLPKSLFSCESLEYLTLSDNDLGLLPPTLAGLSSLRYLDISKNVIEDVPDCIRCCKSLSVLDASVNPIERLSEGFTQLVGLNELYLNDCFLEFLPASFGRLVQLTVLELRDNQLQILPKSIRRLTQLKRLDLGGNIFQEWPDVVCELRKLTELWLDGNELSRVPTELGELTSLVYLDLSRNFIEAIPAQLGSLTELTDLLLCENHITLLPDTIGFLNKLTMLKVSMNQLESVPENLGKLHAIEELDLSHNKLELVPPTIGNLRDMHTLLLDNNVLSSIPNELGQCRRLNVLQLSRNRLEEIPREIGDISELRVFNICRNRLPYLPITIIKLAQLEALWVSSNQSKPNVPLHAELAPDGKTRILINILFPQTEQDTLPKRTKTDAEGYANDAADDDEAPLFRKQRGVTRVAFNLEPLCHGGDEDDDVILTDDDDDLQIDIPLLPKDQNANDRTPLLHNDDHDFHHSIDVSSDLISSNGNGLRIQPASLMVKLPDVGQQQHHETAAPPRYDERNIASLNNYVNGEISTNFGRHYVTDDVDGMEIQNGVEDRQEFLPMSDASDVEHPTDLLSDGGNMRQPPAPGAISASVPNLTGVRPIEVKVDVKLPLLTPVENGIGGDPSQPPKIRTWSSHSHLPAIPVDPTDEVPPVAVEIMNKDDRSSMSSSPSIGPENAAESRPEPPKITKLPIPSRALMEQFSPSNDKKKESRHELIPKPTQPSGHAPNKPVSIEDIPFMDSDVSDEDIDAVVKVPEVKPVVFKPKGAKPPPPPPRKTSVLSKNMKPTAGESSPMKTSNPPTKPKNISTSSTSGLKVFTPAFLQNRKNSETDRSADLDLLSLPVDNKPMPELPTDGLAATDRDSGVGNDVDSQESIPECPDEQDDLPSPTYTPHSAGQIGDKSIPVTTKSVAHKPASNFRDSRPAVPPKQDRKGVSYTPIILTPSTQTPETQVNAAKVPPPVPNKVSANIKMFESISSPEHKAQLTSKSLADLLPSGPRKTEEKAIIRPNNHLNGFVTDKSMPDHTSTPESKSVVTSQSPSLSPVKSSLPESSDVIMESLPDQVMFLRTDDSYADAFTFNKVSSPTEVTSPTDVTGDSPTKRKSRSNSRSKFTESVEAAKQNQFRERLEKIMQQQRSVSQASKAAQNGAAQSLARKSSFTATQATSQPTSPGAASLEKLTAENSFTGNDQPVFFGSPEPEPTVKKHSVHDRMKSKLEKAKQGSSGHQPAALKSSSSSRITRSRPGSAPAAQLLQRRGSNQRNSIAAPENSYEERRTLAPICGDERKGLDARARSKSIEQQLGQLFLDSEEEQLNYNERVKNDVIRRDNRLNNVKDNTGMRGSRNSLCSPPPVRHNMYAKARSSTNAPPAPLADWKHKLLQHIERKRYEKQQINTIQSTSRPRVQQPTQQSIGRIKSPPRTSGVPSRHQPPQGTQYIEHDGHTYVTLTQPQSRPHRQLSKSVTAPSLAPGTRTTTSTHPYTDFPPETGPVRSHFAGNSRAAKLAKQRTFTPGPESHSNIQPMAPRPKSAMEKFSSPPEPLYAEPPSYRAPPQQHYPKDPRHVNPPLPTYEDHLHRRVVAYPPEAHSNPTQRLVRADSNRRSNHRSTSQGRAIYEDLAGYPLRQSGSHESLMDPARYDRQQPYFQNQPIRSAASHDSVLDQPPFQQHIPQYVPSYYNPNQSPHKNPYPATHIPQRYPITHDKRTKYNQDYATYVNVYDYEQSPIEYHNQPQVQSPNDLYRSQLGYTKRSSSVRGDPRVPRGGVQYKPDPAANYNNYAIPPPTSYHNVARQPPTYGQHYMQRENISPTLYRPIAEREDGSVASAFRPYQQQQQQQQQKSHLHHPAQQQMQYLPQHYGLPPNNIISPTEYKNPRPVPTSSVQHGRPGMMSPPSNYQYLPEQSRLPPPHPPNGWNEMPDDVEMVKVSVRRNPTFGFHVMGGVGAGGNPYRPSDDGVFVTHVSPGGAADNKLQAGDKILLVNGSDFVGISHKRAVDLLRNAGKAAVLVVERSLGKPV